jgi:hypothetical protein
MTFLSHLSLRIRYFSFTVDFPDVHIPYIIPRYLTFNFDCNYHRENFAIFRLNGRQDGIERIITLFYKTLSTKWCITCIDKKIFLTFLLTPYLYAFSLFENPSFIIFSVETELIATRSWYRNIHFLRDRIRTCLWHLLHWAWCCFDNCFTCFVQVLL